MPSATPARIAARRQAVGGGTLDALTIGMADLIFPLVTVGFFALAWAYVAWCDGL